MDRDLMPSIPGQVPAAQATGKSFYERWQERWDEIAAMMGRDVPPELEQVQWLVGTWSTGGTSYATPTRPERILENPEARLRWAPALGGHWWRFEGEDRPANRFLFRYVAYLTYDPCGGRWVTMMIEHPAVWWVWTAPGWTGNQLVFEGTMQSLGEVVEVRQRVVHLSAAPAPTSSCAIPSPSPGRWRSSSSQLARHVPGDRWPAFAPDWLG